MRNSRPLHHVWPPSLAMPSGAAAAQDIWLKVVTAL